MSTAPGRGGRRRSLQDDLLDDLRQGVARPTAAPLPETTPAAPEAAPVRSPGSGSPTPALELRFTPRSWSSAGWTRGPGGGGMMIRLGPVCLSLGLLDLG